MITALVVASPMIAFITGVSGIIAWPHVKRACYLAKDKATKGRSNPDADVYALIAGSMIRDADDWKFERGRASWPKPPAKYQYMITYDEGEVKLYIDGENRKVDGYWAQLFREQIREAATAQERKVVYTKLFPNGTGPLLLGKR